MPISLVFYTVKEKQPKHGEEIVFLQKKHAFGSYEIEVSYAVVEYQWDILDDDGYFTGTSILYDPNDPLPPDEPYKLAILVDGFVMKEDIYWCSLKDYYKYFPD